MPIDDELSAARNQYPPVEKSLPELAMEIAGTLLPGAGIVPSILKHYSAAAAHERAEILFNEIEAVIRRQGKEIAQLKERFSQPEFTQTLLMAVDQALHTADRKKIKHLAAVLGVEIASDTVPEDWDEVETLIRDLVQLSQADIRALDILVAVYGRFVSSKNQIPTLATAFQDSLEDQVKAYRAAGFTWDEFYSRCARLAGFGFAIEVRKSQRPSLHSDEHYIFRPTVRGKRLSEALHKGKRTSSSGTSRHHA